MKTLKKTVTWSLYFFSSGSILCEFETKDFRERRGHRWSLWSGEIKQTVSRSVSDRNVADGNRTGPDLYMEVKFVQKF